jgi:hypothetical protein
VRVSDGGDGGFTLQFARQPAASGDAASVLAAEDARFDAMVRADAAALRASLAADLAYVHMTGEVESREQLIAAIAGGSKRYLAIEPEQRSVDFPAPGVALVQGRGNFQVEAGTRRLDFGSRYLAIYVHSDGGWRLRAWQSLRLP